MKVLVADDHGLVREGLKTTLTSFAPDVITLEATDADEVRRLVSREGDLDLILLDLRMPGVSGFALLDMLRESRPDTPVVVLTASEDVQLMQSAIRRGAAGFIPKSASHSIMVAVLRLVLSGGVYIPPAVITRHPQAVNTTGTARPDDPEALTDTGYAALSKLTRRQRDVLELLGNGKTNKAIARELGLSEHTVKIHISAILKTLDVANRTEAALFSRTLSLTGGR